MDPEEAVLQEMAEVKAAVEQREKRERKKHREAKRKARVRYISKFQLFFRTSICVLQ